MNGKWQIGDVTVEVEQASPGLKDAVYLTQPNDDVNGSDMVIIRGAENIRAVARRMGRFLLEIGAIAPTLTEDPHGFMAQAKALIEQESNHDGTQTH